MADSEAGSVSFLYGTSGKKNLRWEKQASLVHKQKVQPRSTLTSCSERRPFLVPKNIGFCTFTRRQKWVTQTVKGQRLYHGTFISMILWCSTVNCTRKNAVHRSLAIKGVIYIASFRWALPFPCIIPYCTAIVGWWICTVSKRQPLHILPLLQGWSRSVVW